MSRIVAERPKIAPEEEMERLARYRVKALTWNDPQYPNRLKEIYDLPPVLYIRGGLAEADEWAVVVVGTRRPTPYGRQAAEELAYALVQSGVTVVSGLARGIDAVAHRAALVSDYPVGTQPRAEYFPRRNRIMAGLSLGVLVVEGDEKSGAIITAGLALEQNREVFAVPGSIFSRQSRGPHSLIRDGAKLVQRVEDVLEELNLTMVPHKVEVREAVPPTDTESALLRHIQTEALHIDDVCRKSGLPVATVSSVLATLELKGLILQVGPMTYVRLSETRAA